MSTIEAILLGLIQGITEFLPISSSGHLVLIQEFFVKSAQGESHMLFDIALHLGTLVAVFIAFRKTISCLFFDFFKMMGDIFKGRYSYKKSSRYQKMLVLILISTVPLFALVPFLSKLEYFFNSSLFVGIALLFTAFLLIASHHFKKGNKTANTITVADSIWIGIMQAVATLPGISRSGSTITVGLFRGLDREFAVEYSFIMSIPAVIGSIILIVKEKAEVFDISTLPSFIIGGVVACVSGYFAIKLIELIIKKDCFIYFGYYCIVVGTGAIIMSLVM